MLFVTGEGGGEKAVERIRAVKEGKEMEEIKDGGDTRCYFFIYDSRAFIYRASTLGADRSFFIFY